MTWNVIDEEKRFLLEVTGDELVTRDGVRHIPNIQMVKIKKG